MWRVNTVIVTAVRLAKPLGPWLTATWNGCKRCAACHHAARYEWRTIAVLLALFCISRHGTFRKGPYFCDFQYRTLTSKWMKYWDVDNALRFYFEYTRFKSLPDYWLLVGDMRFCGVSCEDYSLLECDAV